MPSDERPVDAAGVPGTDQPKGGNDGRERAAPTAPFGIPGQPASTDGVAPREEPDSHAVQKATAIFHIRRAELHLQPDDLATAREHLKAAREALRPARGVLAFDSDQRCAWELGGKPQDGCPRCKNHHPCDSATGVGGREE